jgi:hypothetical protein
MMECGLWLRSDVRRPGRTSLDGKITVEFDIANNQV